MIDGNQRLRKVVIEIDPASYGRLGMSRVFESVKSIELKQIIRMDFEEGIKIIVEEIEMKPGHQLSDMYLPEAIEILDVLKTDGNRYTVLMKSNADTFMQNQMGLDWEQAKSLPEFADVGKLFTEDFKFIPDPPIYISQDRALFGFLGNKNSIEVMLNILRLLVDVKSVRFPREGPFEYDIMSTMTERQKEALTAAQKHGYYKYPRAISTKELAEKLGLTKATLIEHLRKAENALISDVLAGSN
jgi:hypothetical protein